MGIQAGFHSHYLEMLVLVLNAAVVMITWDRLHLQKFFHWNLNIRHVLASATLKLSGRMQSRHIGMMAIILESLPGATCAHYVLVQYAEE